MVVFPYKMCGLSERQGRPFFAEQNTNIERLKIFTLYMMYSFNFNL